MSRSSALLYVCRNDDYYSGPSSPLLLLLTLAVGFFFSLSARLRARVLQHPLGERRRPEASRAVRLLVLRGRGSRGRRPEPSQQAALHR